MNQQVLLGFSIRRTEPRMNESDVVFPARFLECFIKLLRPLHSIHDDQGELAFDMLAQYEFGKLSRLGLLGDRKGGLLQLFLR